MKKSLIALAAVAATGAAFAQSSVTLFGTFDPSIQNISTTTAAGVKTTQNTLANNGRGTSQISVKGVEDLGGGLKASFLYEGDFNVGQNSGATTAAAYQHAIGSGGGEIYAGLNGAFGDIKLGSPNTPSLISQASRQPIGTKIGSGFGSALGTSHVREASSVVYSTPNFAGFTAQVGYAFKGSTGQAVAGTALAADQGAKSDLGLSYANGPLRAGVTLFNKSAVGTEASANKQTNVYAQYDIAGATLYAGMHNETLVNGGKQSGTNFAAKYALTPAVALLGNYAKLDDKQAANADRTVTALGAEYALSKRSTLYVRNVNDKTNAGSKVVTNLLGLQHNF